MIIPLDLKEKSYNIYLERKGLEKASEYFNLDRKVLIVTDSGVPEKYAKTVANQCKDGIICTIPQGEQSKSLELFSYLLGEMCKANFTRSDCVVAVGGGVVGDLAGFVAASYMRGVDFYNIPTTVLSQVDSSIGGKVAIDFKGYKNIVGAFHQPKGVIIDPETLKTLPERQISNGLAEAVKMALTSDKELFEIFENQNIEENIDVIIEKSLRIKKSVVEQDEKEMGLRKILNFGHTLGHAIESKCKFEELYPGECVALGMIPMCSQDIKPRLLTVLKKLNLQIDYNYGLEEILKPMKHDKKMNGDKITVVSVKEIGKFTMETIEFSEFIEKMKGEK